MTSTRKILKDDGEIQQKIQRSSRDPECIQNYRQNYKNLNNIPKAIDFIEKGTKKMFAEMEAAYDLLWQGVND